MSVVQPFSSFTGCNTSLSIKLMGICANKQTHCHMLRAALSLGKETEPW